MRRGARTLIVLLVVAALASLGAAWIAIETEQEAVALILGIPILFVSAITLWVALPSPARIVVTDQAELNLNDLIFYLYDDDDPATGQQRRVPRDYLLQVHVACVNLGDRKGIVASVVLQQFMDSEGQPVALPDAPERLTAVKWVQKSGYVNNHRHFENLTELPPYVLDSNDAVTLRFRCRRGITWSDPDLAALRKVHEALARRIAKARGHVVWRDGSTVHRDAFMVPVRTMQQREYADAIRDLTLGFTILPIGVEPKPVTIE